MHHSRNRRSMRRSGSLITITAVALATAACGPEAATGASQTSVGSASKTSQPVIESTSQTPTEAPSTPTVAPTTAVPTASPSMEAPAPKPTPTPQLKVILRPGDSGAKVRSMQARLKQIGWYSGDVSDSYGARTTGGVKGFQGKRGFAVTGVADEVTYDKLLAMTRKPTTDELNNVKPKPLVTAPTSWDVDQRCLTGRVICISKTTRKLTWVIDGQAQYGMDVRFGSEALPTREGVFSVYKKKVEVISNIYHTPMPYSMFFSGGQAIHYSSNFARLGYNGSSHGCVNVRDWNKIVRLYGDAAIGTKVVVHW